jgi:hypothetical protein
MTSRPRLRPRRDGGLAIAKAGAPLVVMIVAGAYGLSIFMQTHMEYKDQKGRTISKREFTLEEEHKKMMEKLNIRDYTLSRIPRPGEEEQSGHAKTTRTWLEWWSGQEQKK